MWCIWRCRGTEKCMFLEPRLKHLGASTYFDDELALRQQDVQKSSDGQRTYRIPWVQYARTQKQCTPVLHTTLCVGCTLIFAAGFELRTLFLGHAFATHSLRFRSRLSGPLHTTSIHPTCTAARTTVQGPHSRALAGEVEAAPDADTEATMTSRGPWGACLWDLLRTSRFLPCLPSRSARQRTLSLGDRSRPASALGAPKTYL